MTAKILEFKTKQPEPPDPRWVLARQYRKEQQCDKALELYEALTEDGYVGAPIQAACLYLNGGGGVERDWDMARYWLMRGIDEMDDDDAYIGMAALALEGYQDAGSPSDAIDFLWRACDRDNPGAMYLLASIYHAGEVVDKNLEQAAQLYEKAMGHGYVIAMIGLASVKRQQGAYIAWIRLRLKAVRQAIRIAFEDEDDERLMFLRED